MGLPTKYAKRRENKAIEQKNAFLYFRVFRLFRGQNVFISQSQSIWFFPILFRLR